MASFASSATTGGARKDAWTKKQESSQIQTTPNCNAFVFPFTKALLKLYIHFKINCDKSVAINALVTFYNNSLIQIQKEQQINTPGTRQGLIQAAATKHWP